MLRLLFVSIVSGTRRSIFSLVVFLNCTKSSYCHSVAAFFNFKKLLCPCRFSLFIGVDIKECKIYLDPSLQGNSLSCCLLRSGRQWGKGREGLNSLFQVLSATADIVLFRRMSG